MKKKTPNWQKLQIVKHGILVHKKPMQNQSQKLHCDQKDKELGSDGSDGEEKGYQQNKYLVHEADDEEKEGQENNRSKGEQQEELQDEDPQEIGDIYHLINKYHCYINY